MTPARTKQLRLLRILLILSACLLAGVTTALIMRPAPVENRIANGDRSLGGDFTLQSADGPVKLADYRGKAVVLYFGYTSCPDVCPTSLAELAQALKLLPDAERKQVQGIFVSVDPERDTPEKLKHYVHFFSDQIVGVSGKTAKIDQVVHQYGAFYRRVEMPDSAMRYAVDHSSRFYLIDSRGKLVDTLLHNSTPQEMADKLRQILTNS